MKKYGLILAFIVTAISLNLIINQPSIALAQEISKMDKRHIKELIEAFEAEINNGGFDQFFFNSIGNNTAEIISALEAIGAKHTVNILRQAASKFPDGIAPKDRTERQNQLEKISPDGDAFENEDNAFYQYKDNISALLKAFMG